MKYFIKMVFNCVGCEGTDTFEANTEKEAEDIAWEMALQYAQSYVEVIDPVYYTEEELDKLSKGYLGGYVDMQNIDFSFEPYNAEKHDAKL